MFHVGQQVVCIRASSHPIPPEAVDAAVGCVYTVRRIAVRRHYITGLVSEGLHLEEIVNPPSPGGEEWFINAGRFRPVKPTSIEVFRQLLSPIHERETV